MVCSVFFFWGGEVGKEKRHDTYSTYGIAIQ